MFFTFEGGEIAPNALMLVGMTHDPSILGDRRKAKYRGACVRAW